MSLGRNSCVSGGSSRTQPAWTPPRAPLPPHRLAKIANALGISTPSPAMPHSAAPFLSQTFPGESLFNSHPDLPGRVATPSTAPSHSIVSFASSSQTKFFLHVIPPLHLSHEFDTSDTPDLAPPPHTASGYHTQFRRGTLVALQPSLHAQLIAIAKEYALPSTVGLILYLVTTSPQSRQSSPVHFATHATGNEDVEEPGPRLSEEIWKHIWARVLKAEREEVLSFSRGPTPSAFGLGLGSNPSGPSHLRPMIIPLQTETSQLLTYPITPSTSTASSVSDLRSHSKSTPLSSSSLSHSEPDTPDTSRSSDHEINGFDLPGLTSSSMIPILAKVEFDIDRRRAAWYEPWLRGRHMTFSRRAESRQNNRACSRSGSRIEGDVDEMRAPLNLKLVERLQNSDSVHSFTSLPSTDGGSIREAVLDSADEAVEKVEARHVVDVTERLQASDSVLSFTSLASTEEDSTGSTALSDSANEMDEARHVTDVGHDDPLADVFGTDADTWADIHAESQDSQREVNPNVVPLALDASSLTAFPEPELSEDGVDDMDDVEEVRDIIRRMSKSPLDMSMLPAPDLGTQISSPTTTVARMSEPDLEIQISSPTMTIARVSEPPLIIPISAPDSRPHMSSPTTTVARKPIPPPLVLVPSNDIHAESISMISTADFSHTTDGGVSITDEIGGDDVRSIDMEQEYMLLRSPTEEKRVGAVFEDLNLGLDLGDDEEEYDENDPNDRRRSQYLMKARLDEMERTLAQFSPRQLKTSDLEQDLTITHARSKSLLALHAGFTSKLPIEQASNNTARGPRDSDDHVNASEKSWPAVPYSSIAGTSQSPGALSSPQIALNGVSTSVPKSFVPSRPVSPNSVSAETILRKRDVEPSVYPPPLPRSLRKRPDMVSDSPIPLSPDPFGRYSSFPEPELQLTPTYWDPVTKQFTSIPIESRPSLSSVDEGSVASTTPSSRFSADSENFPNDIIVNNAKASAPLVSVKSFKRLWRRSKSSSVSHSQPPLTPTAGQTSFQTSVSPIVDQAGPPPPPSRGLPPVPITTFSRPPSTRPASPSTTPSEKTGVRKSILKTWKSVSGATASSSTPSEPKRDTERPVSNETIKPRRGSILDAGIPPTPKLAEHYLPSNHARTGSVFEQRKSFGRSKMGPSSNLSTASQDVTIHSRTPSQTPSVLQPLGPVSPARSVQSASSRYSQVDGSFETAQYEVITPPRVYPNLSYPYQTLDQE